ncbi:DUF6428 family protein [Bosea sp. NPDC003192]|jgi:hypothetical protein|uniref:DUF6428 family protein n=1 Tax=Bosea sp. NPDC003192 TaxID=3390551 RepID=UPI003CFEEBB4
MNREASLASIDFQGDALLGALLDALEPHASKPLLPDYTERTIQPGYHVTEVKAGAFVTLDCGGNPDRWQETIVQIEDMPSQDGRGPMLAGKFRAILDQVAGRIVLAPEARLTFEIGRPDEPMRVFDVAALQARDGRVILRSAARSALCKPRHRVVQQAIGSACCNVFASKSNCC